jgi:flagellar motor switch protein FliG
MTQTMAYEKLRGPQKAAILMTVLGDDAAAAIFRNLPEPYLQMMTREIAALGPVSTDVSRDVMYEYQAMTTRRDFVSQGGASTADRLLVKAFGEEGARSLRAQMQRTEELKASRSESLRKADPKQLARLLEGEHPQAVALVLGHMEARQAAALLMLLPKETRAESVQRLAKLRQFSPAIAERIFSAFYRRMRSSGEMNKRAYSGFQNVAAMMNTVGSETSKEILESIETKDAKLAASIRELMFTFEDFLQLDDIQLREFSGVVDKKMFALALKGASAELRERFLKTMSSRSAEMLNEEMESLGQVRSKDVVKAHNEMVAQARQLEAEGKMVLRAEEEEGDV